MNFPPDPVAPLQAEIARLTRERDEALAKVAGMRAVLKAGCELLDIESEALRNSIRIVGSPDNLSDAPEDAPTHEAIREMEDWIQTAGTLINDPDATAALNRVQAGAMREAAGIAYGIDAERFNSTYVIEHNRKRYDTYQAERMQNKALNIQAEDARNAILARADAVEMGE